MVLREKILAIFKRNGDPVRKTASEINIPKSTVHYHRQAMSKRIKKSGTAFWESEHGYQFIIRLVSSVIYVFAIKSGNGASRLKEFFDLLNLKDYLPRSETTILRIIKHIEHLILEYKKGVEEKIHCKVKNIELVLGVDETWFDKMYLVCQELSSGYIFFETDAQQRDAVTWSQHIKKTLWITSQCYNQVFCK